MGLRRLYVAQDDDAAGRRATASVIARAEALGIEGVTLTPARGDFNDDLRQLGREALRLNLRPQLAPEDVERFWKAEPGVHVGCVAGLGFVRARAGVHRSGRAAAHGL